MRFAQTIPCPDGFGYAEPLPLGLSLLGFLVSLLPLSMLYQLLMLDDVDMQIGEGKLLGEAHFCHLGVGASCSQWQTAHPQQSGGTTVILVPGAGGATPNDFLIRNTGAFASAGLQTTVAMSAGAIGAAARAIKARGGKPVLVAMSKGTQTAAQAIAQGAPVAGVVFVSGFMSPGAGGSVPAILGTAGKLPLTLVVHHRQDRCPMTTPDGAAAFVGWSGGKASIHWVDGGRPGGPPCRPMSAHGYVGQDQQAVSAIASFARSR